MSTTENEPLVTLTDVEVAYGKEGGGGFFINSDNGVVRAVDGVSLDIYQNDVIVIIGESGCGKTTLGKAAVGLERPTAGTIEYKGQDVWKAKDLIGEIKIPYADIRHNLQIIHQDPGSSLNSHRRLRSILQEPIRQVYPELDWNDRMQRITEMLDFVGMSPPENYIDRYPFQLSGGEQQRVALIRALLMNPELILADEAVAALDVSLRVEMMDLMIKLQDMFDTSFVFISHTLSNARYIAGKTGGRIAVMYLGEIVEIGPTEEVLNNASHPYTKALRWASPELDPDLAAQSRDMPLRKIDIPDPANPPEGCRFHTRCPEAREVCANEKPCLKDESGTSSAGSDITQTACFRTNEDHEYWESPSITADE